MVWLISAIVVLLLMRVGLAIARTLRLRQEAWRERLGNAVPTNAQWWSDHAHVDGEVLYVALGDSTAQGIGASAPGRGYVGQLARHIRSSTGCSVRVINLSVSATTVFGTFRDQLPRLRGLEPDLVTVSIGANNMWDFEPTRFEKDLRRLFAGLPSHAIVADLPSFLFLPAEKSVTRANAILRELAAEFGLTVVPLHARTKCQGLWGVLTQLSGDLFHPNDRGYRVWTSAFIPAVDARLSPRKKSPR